MSESGGEVFVTVRPDLSKFRAELEAELRALGTRGVNVPVTLGGPGTAGQAKALQAQVAGIGEAAAAAAHPLQATAAAMREVGVVTEQTIKVTGDYAAVAGTLPPTLRQQAIASEEAARAANDLLLSEKGLTRANTEVAASSKAAAAGMTDEAVAARAASGSSSTAARGVASTALSFIGLRGATLAASGAFLAGAASVAVFAKSVGAAVSFDRQLHVLQATTGATADEMRRAGAEARALGRDLSLPGVSAQDAAEAITELAKAGLSLDDAMAAARGSLELATAANIDNADAVNLVANALNAFNLPGREAAKVADALANSANASQGSITDVGLALQQSAAVAHLAGLSFRDTIVLLTELQRAGIRASDAGTSLRTALLRLIKPPNNQVKQVLADLAQNGVRLRDSFGRIRPEFFSELTTALGGLSSAQRQNTIAILGGSDAIRTYAILSRSSIGDLQALQQAIDQQGTALNLSAARTQGLGGSTEQLKNNLSDLAITFGHIVNPALKLFVDNINEAVSDLQSFVGVAQKALNPLKNLADQLHVTGVAGEALGHIFRVGMLGPIGPIVETVHVIKEIKGAIDGSKESASNFGAISTDAFRQMMGPTQFENNLIAETEGAFDRAAAAARRLNAVSLAHLTGEVNNLLEAITDVEISGGTLQQQLGVIDKAIAGARKLVAADVAAPGQGNKAVAAKRRQDKATLNSLIQHRKQITQQMAANAKAAADERKRVAEEAQKRLDEADQKLIDTLSLRRGALQNAISKAGLTPSLADDIRFQRQLTAELRRERAIVQARIHDEKLRKQTLQELDGAITDSISATNDLVKKQREDAAARKKARQDAIRDRRDRAQESRELDVQIAQAKGNQGQELRAHQALLRYLIQRRKHTTEGSLEWKRLTVDIENERKAIKDLKDATQDRNREFASLTFAFLQRQAGFAASILSNILPRGATAGTVGGGAISTGTVPLGESGVVQRRGRGDFTTAVAQQRAETAGPPAPTGGQMSRLIMISQQQLSVLMKLAGVRAAPEAVTHIAGVNAWNASTGW